MKLYSKKMVATSLALTLLLGGGTLYAAQQKAQAETTESSGAQEQAADGQKNGAKQWKHEGQMKPFEGKEGERRFGPKMALTEEAAAILGMDKDALAAAMKDKSLAEIAKEKGIGEADLIAKLQTERAAKIDAAVKSGKLTAEQAEKMKKGMAKHLKFMVNHKGLGFFHGKGHGMKKAVLPAPDKLASLLNLTEEQLKAQLKAGKSLAEIAQAQGISRDQLIAKIKEELTPRIEKIVDHKRGDDSVPDKSKPKS